MNIDKLSEAVAILKSDKNRIIIDEDKPLTIDPVRIEKTRLAFQSLVECAESVIASSGELPERKCTIDNKFNEAIDLCAVALAKVKAERDELRNKHRECLYLISQDEHRILEVMKENHSLKARVKELEKAYNEYIDASGEYCLEINKLKARVAELEKDIKVKDALIRDFTENDTFKEYEKVSRELAEKAVENTTLNAKLSELREIKEGWKDNAMMGKSLIKDLKAQLAERELLDEEAVQKVMSNVYHANNGHISIYEGSKAIVAKFSRPKQEREPRPTVSEVIAYESGYDAGKADGAKQVSVTREAILNTLGIEATNYISGYELRADNGDYTPNDHEEMLINDCVSGLMEEQADAILAMLNEKEAVFPTREELVGKTRKAAYEYLVGVPGIGQGLNGEVDCTDIAEYIADAILKPDTSGGSNG